MTRTLRLAAAFSGLVLCRAMSASPLWIYPTSGPTSGGTEVIIKGGPFSFCPSPYCRPYPPQVFFNRAPATSVTLVDESTLRVIAPPYFPGTFDVYVDQWWKPIHTTARFTFAGEFPNEGVERILVPLLTGVRGAYGGLFYNELRMGATNDPPHVAIYGVDATCPATCISLDDDAPLMLEVRYAAYEAVADGTPGRFVYVPKTDFSSLTMHLLVHHATTAGRTGGATELPLVRDREFTTRRVTLLGIPTDPRLRNTLRIYSPVETAVLVTVEGRAPLRIPLTRPKADVFTPYYATFSDFPTGTSTISISVQPTTASQFPTATREPAPIWAFVSVTNNETQMITTITPQP